jgi:hypothetical protein
MGCANKLDVLRAEYAKAGGQALFEQGFLAASTEKKRGRKRKIAGGNEPHVPIILDNILHDPDSQRTDYTDEEFNTNNFAVTLDNMISGQILMLGGGFFREITSIKILSLDTIAAELADQQQDKLIKVAKEGSSGKVCIPSMTQFPFSNSSSSSDVKLFVFICVRCLTTLLQVWLLQTLFKRNNDSKKRKRRRL